MSAEATRLHIRTKKRLSITTNVRAADAVSEPAALTRFIMKTAVQTSFWTGRWQNMRWQSVRTVPASIFHWCRISALTATAMAKMMRRSCRISVCLQALTRVALDQACADACLQATPIANSQLGEHLAKPDWHSSSRSFPGFQSECGMGSDAGSGRKNRSGHPCI